MLLLLLLLLLVLLVLLFFIYIIYYAPPWLIQRCQQRWPDVLWHVSTSQKVVALTIDDGPSKYTTEILDILKANDATATFFIIGSHVTGLKDEAEAILQTLIRNGNEMGNHAMYDEPSYKLRDAELVLQITKVDEIINSAYKAVNGVTSVVAEGSVPRYFRPGSGFFNTRLRKVVSRLGHTLILGDVYPHDAQISLPKINTAHILRNVRPGSIMICHDGRPWTLPMLGRVLPELKRRGYRVVRVTDLLQYSGL